MQQNAGSPPSPRAHGVSTARGFLPDDDPLVSFDEHAVPAELAPTLARLDDLAAAVPDHLEDHTLRERTRDLDVPDPEYYDDLTDGQLVRLCQVSGFLASAHVHAIDHEPVDSIPAGVAVPLYETSRRLGREPMLAYDTLSLHNWRLRDPGDGFEPENVDALVAFTDYDDERWFVAIHVAIEAAAGRALTAAGDAHAARAVDDAEAVGAACLEIAESLRECTQIMERMTEGNDPDVFANEFRPYFDGFSGVTYEGVDAMAGPQSTRGGSGAQSSVLPALDGALDIEHAATSLIDHLRGMRDYMPPAHRELVAAFEETPSLRDYVAAREDARTPNADDDTDAADLRVAYDEAVEALHAFREVHLSQVMQYIVAATGDVTGTGGTDFMRFLGTMRSETADAAFGLDVEAAADSE